MATVPDHEEAARDRAERIRDYWLSEGYDVQPTVRGVLVQGRQCWVVEMPGFVNGMPPKACRVQTRRAP